jgi:hypothetical protein
VRRMDSTSVRGSYEGWESPVVVTVALAAGDITWGHFGGGSKASYVLWNLEHHGEKEARAQARCPLGRS